MAPIYQVNISEKKARALRDLGFSLSPVTSSGTIVLDLDPADLFILPEATHGTRKYTPLEVAQHRLGMNRQVRKVAANLELDLRDTAKEKDGTPYIGNIINEQALMTNASLNGRTLSLRRMMDCHAHVKAGAEGKVKVYNGNGREMSREQCGVIYDEMFGVREPWRGEHVDTWIVPEGRKLLVHSDHILKDGKLIAQTKEELESCLMQDGWASSGNLTGQGMPTRSGNDFYFGYPIADRVAGVNANSGRLNVYCDWNRELRNPRLGVRYVREARNA